MDEPERVQRKKKAKTPGKIRKDFWVRTRFFSFSRMRKYTIQVS